MRIWPLWFRVLLILALAIGALLIVDYAQGQCFSDVHGLRYPRVP